MIHEWIEGTKNAVVVSDKLPTSSVKGNLGMNVNLTFDSILIDPIRPHGALFMIRAKDPINPAVMLRLLSIMILDSSWNKSDPSAWIDLYLYCSIYTSL